jgi:SAM-dependent methyltransferase
VCNRITWEEIAALDIGTGQMPALAITGERTVPDVWHENYWFRRHEAVYAAVAAGLGDGDVLEAGCGEGYGAARLAAAGAHVVALDYDLTTVGHVRRRYPDVSVVRGNLVALPFDDRTYDAVVSLQTVEHLWDQEAFVAECRRVLRSGGRLVLSTPNRLTFPPGNVFHTTELSEGELIALVSRHGGRAALRGLRHGPELVAWERRHGSIVNAQLAAPPETWPVGLADRVRAIGVDDFILDETAIDTSLDLVAVVTFD